MWFDKNTMKTIALTLLLVFSSELLLPVVAVALTTGPSQPEMQSFEPVGTTDMVDMFSGDFVYNIPLMDIEGYPVNISYHGGVTMEQEASWVGLGWNINPGEINRTVRGVPDDFNGDSLFKDFNIKPENTLRVGIGAGTELAGVGDPNLGVNLSLGANVNISNYKGVSADFSFGSGIDLIGCVSTGVNIGIGSQTGASIDLSSRIDLSASQIMSKDMAGGIGIGATGGIGYSTRTGIKDLSLSFSMSAGASKAGYGGAAGFSSTDNIPIGVHNMVPVITNSSTMNSIEGRLKLGGEAFSVLAYGNVSAMFSTVTYNNDASRSSYGYMYLQNASRDNTSILDFTRDKDGMFNKSMQYLPPCNLTYDIYSVSGQGTGGVFRPYRNDFGNVYDPYTTGKATSSSGEAEAGAGNLFEIGWDYRKSGTVITSGPWQNYQRTGTASKGFTSTAKGSIYENIYFKEAGELTQVNPDYFSAIGGNSPITPDQAMNLPQAKPGSSTQRDPRANLIYCRTAGEASNYGIGYNPNIISYHNDFSNPLSPATDNINRVGTGNFQRKQKQISVITQVEKDGKKYVYGIPAMNNVQREVTFSVDPNSGSNPVNLGDGAVFFSGADATHNNGKGRDNYYSSTVTPSYAHSYLLTSVLSADYVDVTGNGITDDDLGSYTKFNYSRMDSDYRWVAPYSAYLDSAQYNPGFWSDKLDDKGSFVCGSREQWMLHSIETKNFIAEYYTSVRNDGKGINTALLNTGSSLFSGAKATGSNSYELDSVKLYNKHDRLINGGNAIPVKTVFFVYGYTLCNNVPNSSSGKLTLNKIFFRYGNSQKSMLSPYRFGYGYNPGYNLCSKDRWGNYKPNNAAFTNYEYPYVNQNDTADNTYASAWSLTNIQLPSGGLIQANYESDDYAYVQDKPANEMFMVTGLGNNPNYSTGAQLYQNNNSPFLYAYFLRRPGNELSALSFAQNYLGMNYQASGQNLVYFNFNVGLTGGNNSFEQIKGYANVSLAGICPNNASYGYIKFIPVTPTGGGANLNPVTYTALNVGRYNLPQVIFPGADPHESDFMNILSGLKGAFKELLKIGKSPIVNLVSQGGGRNVNLNKSYVRLQSVGLCKKGGGQRVHSLCFYDQWQTLAGYNEQNATYGKVYDYTINDPTYGKISSGVASYEPIIGGDENPLRQPVKYTGQSGSTWPPNDPVDLYQETPIGESLFPGAQVGYSNITVTSVHQSYGKSSQGVDKYQFYTAKDFPAQVIATSINTNATNHYDFFSQKNLLTATQGYTLIFNNMHGKPKRVEHDVYNPLSGTTQPISYQVYNYKTSGNKLNNNVKCLVKSGSHVVVQNKLLGVEEDVTMDSRQKDEETHCSTVNGNLNFFIIELIIPIPVPIPYSFGWGNDNQNEFQAAVVTKVVQQYGILDNIQSYNEGALTTLQNELFDPFTGQPVVTSVNNEFHDKEYTTNIPASWVYNGMGSAFNTIGYKDTGTIVVNPHNIGMLLTTNPGQFQIGDELWVNYTFGGVNRQTTAWFMGRIPIYETDTIPHVHDYYVYDTTRDSIPVTIPDSLAVTVPVTRNSYCMHSNPVTFECDNSNTYPSDGTICSHSDMTVYTGVTGTFSFPQTCFDSTYEYPLTAYVNVTVDYRQSFDPSTCDTHYHHTLTFADSVHSIAMTPLGSFLDFDVTIPGSYFSPPESFNIPVCGIVHYSTILDTIGYDTVGYDTTGWDTTGYSYYNVIDSTLAYDTTYTYSTTEFCHGLHVLPRFPLNTPGWSSGNTLTNVTLEVISSGQTNRLNENVETYTSMDNPVGIGSAGLNTYLTNLINLSAITFADSNTTIPYGYLANADTINPYAIGERGVWRLFTEYAYLTGRNYASVTARNSGLFGAQSLFAPPESLPSCLVNPFNYFAPYNSDPNWHAARTITKWSPFGKEVENLDAVGNYSNVLFGYNNELPVAVASNSKQGDILTDGFEDYNLLQPGGNLMQYRYSPFNIYGTTALSSLYVLLNILGSSTVPSVTQGIGIAHTGRNSLLIPTGGGSIYTLTLPYSANTYPGLKTYYNYYYSPAAYEGYVFSPANEYMPFKVRSGQQYIVSFWVQQAGSTPNITNYTLTSGTGVTSGSSVIPFVKMSPVIDGWQQFGITFTAGSGPATLKLPAGYYIDDFRVCPANSNMKSFVYYPYNEKLMATLDENNFATFYEYDQEGNLVRTKKETPKGIMTITESRSANPN